MEEKIEKLFENAKKRGADFTLSYTGGYWIEISRMYIGDGAVWCLYKCPLHGGSHLVKSSSDLEALKPYALEM